MPLKGSNLFLRHVLFYLGKAINVMKIKKKNASVFL